MATYPTPFAAVYSKLSPGISDTSCASGVYKFMGCTVVGVNASLGFNGTASSLNVTLVEDNDPRDDLYSQSLSGIMDLDIGEETNLPFLSSDSFIPPIVPSLYAFSLPSGGVGQPHLYDTYNLNQSDFYGNNVPFYLCGIVTGYSEIERDVSGKTISVNISDPRELLSGVQCLLNGFALSQSVGGGFNRYSNINNIIDVFGYFNYGWESGSNEYGMPWNKIKQALEAVGCKLYDITFEFTFVGQCFDNTPDWYRISETTIDLMSLIQRVAQDGGSDLIVVARKVNSNAAVVEFRGIKRENIDPLYRSEISGFVSARSDIVDTVRIGREFKNEPESVVIVGGMKNANYVAWPSEYIEDMHLVAGQEDYNQFPKEITTRLFGGSGTTFTANENEDIVEEANQYTVKSGAIFPFWGFAPSGEYYPLIEPFLSLDHLAFAGTAGYQLGFKEKIPLCKLATSGYVVRNVVHNDVFLDGDGDADSRPFTRLESYKFSDTNEVGYIRGLPLNTEVLKAALNCKEAFEAAYSIDYPDIADQLDFSTINWAAFKDDVLLRIFNNELLTAKQIETDLPITPYLGYNRVTAGLLQEMTNIADNNGKADLNAAEVQAVAQHCRIAEGLENLRSELYLLVRQYAEDLMGKQFLVCLPKSFIMNRIWNGLEVPTRPNKPEIEYVPDSRGYWTYVPTEFDGISNTASGTELENQIIRRFMAEDGRFEPMAIMDYHPSGNINFNSNGLNRAMFQDLDSDSFRPNKIAETTPNFVCIACDATTLEKRPDLAVVTLKSGPVRFDPTDGYKNTADMDLAIADDEFLIKKGFIAKYLWKQYRSNNDFWLAITALATAIPNVGIYSASTALIKNWSNELWSLFGKDWFQFANATENVMDFKAIILPLTSRWVSYGPWYTEYADAKGMVRIDTDDGLVPWNFGRPSAPSGWDATLNVAGQERANRSLARLEFVDTASISVAGYPEIGLGKQFGYNSNLTSISIEFAIGGIKTIYNLSTYDATPGTYRKGDYDNLSRAAVDTRPKVPDVKNYNLFYMSDDDGTNRFGN